MITPSYEIMLFGFGLAMLLVAWLPLVVNRAPISVPIISLLIGILLSSTNWLHVAQASMPGSVAAERMSEIVILIALMGAGLRLDRRFSWRHWGATWRLLAIAMPLTIIGVFIAGKSMLGLSVPAALLLASVLAPTDPVLAADVQTGPPGRGDDGETRFGLTSEAGLNDGLAMPFVLLAIGLQRGTLDWGHWLAFEMVLDLAMGAAIGWVGGKAMGLLLFRLPLVKLSDTGDGLVAIGITLICYATTQIVGGNGFVAVFVAALSIRSTKPRDSFHTAMADFASQIERVLVMFMLIIFGWTVGGGLMNQLTLAGAGLGMLLLFVIRPVAAWLGFIGSHLPRGSRMLMAFFGVRGIGTLFYLQYAFNRAVFSEKALIWSTTAFVIIASILLHGISSTPLMAWADRQRQGKPRGRDRELLESGYVSESRGNADEPGQDHRG